MSKTSSGPFERRQWSLAEGRLVFHHADMDVFWEVPEEFMMPTEAVLSLAEFVLLAPYGQKVDIVSGPLKETGRVAVAFSGGVDSAAALELLPDPLPIYTEVKARGMHKLENAQLSVEEVGGIAIRSNYDEFAASQGKRNGYFGAAGFTITCIVLSDHFNIKTICDGNILDFAYLHGPNGQGTKFTLRDRSAIFAVFRKAGLQYCMPCGGLTEVVTTKLAKHRKFAMGCMRGTGGKPCQNCMKCYRKGALQGKPIPTNKEVDKKLSGDLIPVLPSLLWARDTYGASHPSFDNIEKNIDWVDKWYPRSLELIPEDLHDFFKKRLSENGIKTMEDVHYLETWVSDNKVSN